MKTLVEYINKYDESLIPNLEKWVSGAKSYEEIKEQNELYQHNAFLELIKLYLREIHMIHVDLGKDDLHWFHQLIDISKYNFNYDHPQLTSSQAGFKTYEEALENGLKKAFRILLKIHLDDLR
jgi:hypothetical protein